MWKTLRGLGFVYANGNGHGGQSSGRRQADIHLAGHP